MTEEELQALAQRGGHQRAEFRAAEAGRADIARAIVQPIVRCLRVHCPSACDQRQAAGRCVRMALVGTPAGVRTRTGDRFYGGVYYYASWLTAERVAR